MKRDWTIRLVDLGLILLCIFATGFTLVKLVQAVEAETARAERAEGALQAMSAAHSAALNARATKREIITRVETVYAQGIQNLPPVADVCKNDPAFNAARDVIRGMRDAAGNTPPPTNLPPAGGPARPVPDSGFEFRSRPWLDRERAFAIVQRGG